MSKGKFHSMANDIEFGEKVLFFGTAHDFEEFEQVTGSLIKNISSLSPKGSLRQIVIETWLLLDYSVRMILASGLEISRFSSDEYDVLYKVLPQSFERCLEVLDNILKTQRKLKPDPKRNQLTFNIQFLLFIKKNHPKFYIELTNIEQTYYAKYFPELVTSKKPVDYINSLHAFNVAQSEKYCVSPQWIEAMKHIDTNWIKKAKRINNIRNQAAHLHKDKLILKAFGLTGTKAHANAKKECVQTIESLLSLKKRRKQPRKK